MRALLIANTNASTVTPRKMWVIEKALSSELKLEVVLTKRKEHATHLAKAIHAPLLHLNGHDPPAVVGCQALDLVLVGEDGREELGAYIRQQRESARLSLRKLSRIAGVSNPYLSQIEREQGLPRSVISAVAGHLTGARPQVTRSAIPEREDPFARSRSGCRKRKRQRLGRRPVQR
jgi:hypothetical protein